MEPSLSVGRGVHADGGLLHPDALVHESAAHAREPDDPRQSNGNHNLPNPWIGDFRIRSSRSGPFPYWPTPPAGIPAPLTTRDVLRYATMNGAKALRLDSKTGSLTPGKEADIIILDATRDQRGAAQPGAGRGRIADGPHQRRDRDRRRQDPQVEGAAARCRSAASATTARGLARLHFQQGGRPAGSVQQPIKANRRKNSGRLWPPSPLLPRPRNALRSRCVASRIAGARDFEPSRPGDRPLEAGLLLRNDGLFPGAVDLAECFRFYYREGANVIARIVDRTPFNLNRNASSRLRRPLRADCFHCEYREGEAR